MRVAFYAPLKSPTSSSPSGDRRMARLMLRAIGGAGHQVGIASTLRAFDGQGDENVQKQIKWEAESQIVGILDAIQEEAMPRPDLWFTYHLYHKAPDWIGPAVADALNIPYVVAEASFAPKQSGGLWDLGHRAVLRSLHRANLVIGLNPVDAGCVRDVLRDDQRYVNVAPFIDTEPYATAMEDRATYRAMAAGQYDLDGTTPWLMTTAMMRPGDKLASYQLLARALESLQDIPWQLVIAGDGDARDDVRDAFVGLRDRVVWLGTQDSENLAGLYAAADLYVWPAINEAFGMSFLEAQSAGLPVVAGDSGGVSGVVHAPNTGVLVDLGDVDAFSAAVRDLLSREDSRVAMGDAACQQMRHKHSLFEASRTISSLLNEVITA